MKIKSTYLIGFQAILFVIFLLTTFYFNRFAADDYHFIGELKTSSPKQIYNYLYSEWHGRWTSNFLLVYLLKFHQSPFFLMVYNTLTTGLLCIGVSRFFKSLNTYYQFKFNNKTILIYSIVFITVLFFSTISANDTWLWYTSSIVYLWSTIAFFYATPIFFKNKKTVLDYLLLIIGTVYIGGSNEPLTLLSLVALTFLILKKKEITPSILGILILLVSFLINYLSSGTIHRNQITPSLGIINLLLYTGYSSVKFLFFSIGKTFIPALFLAIPFYLLGNKINHLLKNNFKPIKGLFQSFLVIVVFVFINQSIVVYALGGLSPDRSGMASTILIAIIIVRYLFLLGNYHQKKYNSVKHLMFLNVIGLILFNIYFAKIHANYSSAVDGRNGYIKICRSQLIKVDALPSSGYIYSAEITGNPNHFKNQHLKKGLGVKKDIVMVNY